jgi:cytoskeletal protein RodZ
MHVLSNIERENHEQLPSSAVVKGFLKLYADFVGAEREVAVQKYCESLNEKEAAAVSGGILRRGSKFWIHILLSFGTLAGIVLLSVYFTSDKAGTLERKQTEIHKQDMERTDSVFEMAEHVAPPAGDNSAVQIKHRLLIQAVDETWIKIIIDDKSPEKYTLAPGDRLELEALSFFNILIGDAGGVKLTLNEKPVKLSGKSGQLTTLQLP